MWSLLVNFTFNWLYKVFFLLYRLVEVFRLLPLRFGRLINHIGEGLQKLLEVQSLSSIGILFWWIEFLCYLLDSSGLNRDVTFFCSVSVCVLFREISLALDCST